MKKLLSLLLVATIITSTLCVSYFAFDNVDNLSNITTSEPTDKEIETSTISTSDEATPDEITTEPSSSTTESSTIESSTEPTTTEPTEVKVSSIKLNATSKTLYNGKSTTLKATVFPINATNKSLTWKSSNTKVATVDKNGKVKATTNKGATYVNAIAKDGSKIRTRILVVVGEKVKKITLNKTSITLSRSTKNITYQLKKSIKNKNATYKGVSWYSSNKNVATVNSNGKVTIKHRGKVVITVKAKDGSNKSAKCKIIVKQLVTKLSYNSKKQAKEVYRNKTIKFAVTVVPSNANNKGLTYSSSNKKVATVNSNGVVKGIKAGTVTITAKAKDSSKKIVKIKVKVKKPPITINTKLSNDEFKANKKYVGMYVDELNKYFESCGAVINPNLKGSSQYCVGGTSTFRNNTSIKDFMVGTIGLWTNRRATDYFRTNGKWGNITTDKELAEFENVVEKISCVIFDEYNPKKMLDPKWNGWKQWCSYTESDDIKNIYVYAIPNGGYDYEIRMYWGTNWGLKQQNIPLVKE